MSIEIAKKYVAGLSLRRAEREEVSNVIMGYMADCEAKDKRIEELEHYNLGLANEAHELKSLLHDIDLAVRKNDWPRALEMCLKSREIFL